MFMVDLLLFLFADFMKYGRHQPNTIMLKVLVLFDFFLFSSALVLDQNAVNNVFYELDNINTNEVQPVIQYLDKFDKSKSPVNRDDFKDYVIIKAKRKIFDISPYVMMRQLDDVKYMVLWLNLYCEMHPDCNKKTLNKELQKVSYYYFTSD